MKLKLLVQSFELENALELPSYEILVVPTFRHVPAIRSGLKGEYLRQAQKSKTDLSLLFGTVGNVGL